MIVWVASWGDAKGERATVAVRRTAEAGMRAIEQDWIGQRIPTPWPWIEYEFDAEPYAQGLHRWEALMPGSRQEYAYVEPFELDEE